MELPTKKRKFGKCRTATQKYERNTEKYKLLPPCKNTCKSKCLGKIPNKRREDIHDQFWKLSYNERRMWIHSHIKKYDIKRSRSDRKGFRERKYSRTYLLPNETGEDTKVCKSFFLKTLGYKNDKIITVTLAGAAPDNISPGKDQRGKHSPPHKLTETNLNLIKSHINSFNPAVSHYRREHAPLRKYLPSELTIKQMYDDFNVRHPGLACCETYRQILTSMNISFAKLGEEECEFCMCHDKHNHAAHNEGDVENQTNKCDYCESWEEHVKRAKACREAYQNDATKEHDNDQIYLSVDLQKVIMLPRLPGVKTCLFTKRIVVFNESFAPLGGRTSEKIFPQ